MIRRLGRRTLLLEKQGSLMRRGAFSAAGNYYREPPRFEAPPAFLQNGTACFTR